jgi:hypothetical protein
LIRRTNQRIQLFRRQILYLSQHFGKLLLSHGLSP